MEVTSPAFLKYNNTMKRSSPTLSIITLTRNRAPLLEKNFASLMGQLRPKDEIIVIDNGSTDNTRQVISTYKKKLQIRAYSMQSGKYPHLYNTGVRHAKNEIIVFLDDDCVAEKSLLKNIRSTYIHRPNIIIQGITYSLPKGNIYAEIMGDHYRHFIATNLLDRTHLRILDNKNAAIPRSLILKLDGFCEKLDCGSEDIEFGIRARSHGIPIILNRTIVAHHHERTTFKDFVVQHIRFATCERHLDGMLPKDERIGLVRMSKLLLQLQSAAARELFYLRHGELHKALLLPFLYLTMTCIRTYGYITST